MKKLTSILLVFAIALSCFVFVGCDTEDKLGFFKERKIKRDYIEQFDIRGKNVGDVVLDYYGGNYNGYEIVMLDTECHDPETRTEQIGDTTITYYDSNQLYAWGDGEFYPLNNVVSTNKISKEDVKSIIAEYSSKITQFADVCDEYDFDNFSEYRSILKLLTTFDYDSIQFSRIIVVVDPKLSHNDMNLSENYFDKDLIRNISKTKVEGYPNSDAYIIILHKHSLIHMIYAIEKIKEIPGVIDVFPLIVSGLMATASDPAYVSNNQWGLKEINIEKVWDFVNKSNGINVGIIDTGIITHEDLLGNLHSGWDFNNNSSNTFDDVFGHGTFVSGVIGAVSNNDKGLSGVSWNVNLFPLQILNAVDGAPYNGYYNYCFWAKDLEEALIYANGNNGNMINIVNISLCVNESTDTLFNAVQSYNGLMVCAAGNDGLNLDDNDEIYPQLYNSEVSNMIVVGAIDENNERSVWINGKSSNYGANTVDIYAPGSSIYSTYLNNSYLTDGGTSYAAPFVTGVAALLWSVDPNLTALEIKECILNGADEIEIEVEPGFLGMGRETQVVKKLNAWGAFKYLMENYIPEVVIPRTPMEQEFSVNGNSEYYLEKNPTVKLTLQFDEEFEFELSGSQGTVDIILYDSQMNEIDISKTWNNSQTTVEFAKELQRGTYYVRGIYTGGTDTLTLSISHDHTMDDYRYYSKSLHVEACACGLEGTETSQHVVLAGSVSNHKGYCMYCGEILYLLDDAHLGIMNINKYSINGSYILPNGIIVLVDSDIEAYLNGTLVFYDKNNLPVVQ